MSVNGPQNLSAWMGSKPCPSAKSAETTGITLRLWFLRFAYRRVGRSGGLLSAPGMTYGIRVFLGGSRGSHSERLAVVGCAEDGLDRSRGDVIVDADPENRDAITSAAF